MLELGGSGGSQPQRYPAPCIIGETPISIGEARHCDKLDINLEGESDCKKPIKRGRERGGVRLAIRTCPFNKRRPIKSGRGVGAHCSALMHRGCNVNWYVGKVRQQEMTSTGS